MPFPRARFSKKCKCCQSGVSLFACWEPQQCWKQNLCCQNIFGQCNKNIFTHAYTSQSLIRLKHISLSTDTVYIGDVHKSLWHNNPVIYIYIYIYNGSYIYANIQVNNDREYPYFKILNHEALGEIRIIQRLKSGVLLLTKIAYTSIRIRSWVNYIHIKQ